MYLAKFSLNTLLMIDLAVIVDIFKHKNVHHGVALQTNQELAISTFRSIIHETNFRISRTDSRNKENSSFFIPHFYQKVGVILNTSCADWKDVFNIMSTTKAFKSPFSWLIVTEDLEETTKVLSKYPIEIDSDFTIIFKQDKQFSLYEIFNTGFALNGEMVIRQIGFWNTTLHIEKKNRRDLKGLMLRTTLVITKNQKVVHETFLRFMEREQPSLTALDPMHKFKYFSVIKYFEEMFNISFTFQRSNSWGYPTNDSFDGMVGALQRFESDVAGSPMFVRTDRMLAVDYAAETWKTSPCFIFRHPKHSGGFFTIYTRPLSNNVWYCIIAFLVLSSTILGLMLQCKGPSGEDLSTSRAILFVWGAVCQQGQTISRNTTSVKIVVFVTFVFTLTLYQYYNATVVSTLLRDPPKNIKTMKDLLKSDLKAGIEDVLYNKDFFKRTTDPLALEMYNKKITADGQYNFYPAEEGMKAVKQGGFAFHLDTAVAYRIMKYKFSERELCEATEISMYVPQYLGAAVSKGSPYKEHIAYGIRKLKESGIMHRLQTIWDESRPGCVRRPDTRLTSVSLMEFSTALMVLAVGFVTAFLVLLLELVHWKCMSSTAIQFRY